MTIPVFNRFARANIGSMRIAIIGSGISGLGAAYAARARVTTSRCSSATRRAGGHANTVVPRRARARHGLPRPQRAQLPAALPALRTSSAWQTQQSEMSFSVSCRGCGLEYSGRRPFAQPRNAAIPRFLRLLLGRSGAGCGPRGRRRATSQQSLGRLPRRARLLAALPAALPRAADVGALVDRAGARARVPGRVRDPLLRQPRDARLRPLALAHGHRRQPPLRRRDRRAARRPRLRLGRARALDAGARRTASTVRTGDGSRSASTRRRRHARRPGAARCSRIRPPTSGASSARSRTRRTRPCSTPTRRFLPAAAPRARRGTTGSARRRPARRSPTTSTGCRRLDADARLLRDAERGVAGRARARARSPTSTRSTRSRPLGRRRSCAPWPAPRTQFAGAYYGNGFHEDGLASGVAAARALGVKW